MEDLLAAWRSEWVRNAGLRSLEELVCCTGPGETGRDTVYSRHCEVTRAITEGLTSELAFDDITPISKDHNDTLLFGGMLLFHNTTAYNVTSLPNEQPFFEIGRASGRERV